MTDSQAKVPTEAVGDAAVPFDCTTSHEFLVKLAQRAIYERVGTAGTVTRELCERVVAESIRRIGGERVLAEWFARDIASPPAPAHRETTAGAAELSAEDLRAIRALETAAEHFENDAARFDASKSVLCEGIGDAMRETATTLRGIAAEKAARPASSRAEGAGAGEAVDVPSYPIGVTKYWRDRRGWRVTDESGSRGSLVSHTDLVWLHARFSEVLDEMVKLRADLAAARAKESK